jgi:hypothetical protein
METKIKLLLIIVRVMIIAAIIFLIPGFITSETYQKSSEISGAFVYIFILISWIILVYLYKKTNT